MAEGTSKAAKADERRMDSRFRGYLGAAALSSLGGTATYLSSAILIASVGTSLAETARNTSLVFGLSLVSSSLSVVYATRVARRLGSVPTLYWARAALLLRSHRRRPQAHCLAYDQHLEDFVLGRRRAAVRLR